MFFYLRNYTVRVYYVPTLETIPPNYVILSIDWVYRKWWMPQFMSVLFEQTIWNMDIFWVALFSEKKLMTLDWCSFFGWWKFFIGKISHVCSFPLESFDLMHQCIVNSKFRVWSLLTDFYQKLFDFFYSTYVLSMAPGSWLLSFQVELQRNTKRITWSSNFESWGEFVDSPSTQTFLDISRDKAWILDSTWCSTSLSSKKEGRSFMVKIFPQYGSADGHVVFSRTYTPWYRWPIYRWFTMVYV